MSTTVVSRQPEPATKIEKLEAKLASFEESFEKGEKLASFEKSFEKEEKLRAKLRYLHFFENFHISPAPASFVCYQCKAVEVLRKEVLNQPCPNSKREGCTHQVTTNYKKVIEVQCMDQETHKKEWQEQGKSRQEVRQEIRREFNKQEQGGRGRRGNQERNKDLVKLHQGDFNLNPTNLARAEKAPAPASVLSPPAKGQGKEQNKEEENGGKLLHGDSCKTCVRMNKLTGQVLPHSPNY